MNEISVESLEKNNAVSKMDEKVKSCQPRSKRWAYISDDKLSPGERSVPQ